jgi:hypothetical protein
MNSAVNISKKTVANHLKRIERRTEKRIELSLPMTLLGQKVKSENTSPGGVYFEVITNDIEKYSPGKTSEIEIIVSTSTPRLPKKPVKLTGTGMIIRVDEIETINQDRKLGVALKFIKKLEIFSCKITIGVGFMPDYQQYQHNNQII